MLKFMLVKFDGVGDNIDDENQQTLAIFQYMSLTSLSPILYLTINLVFFSSLANPIKSAMSCSSSSFALSVINFDQILPQEGILSFFG